MSAAGLRARECDACIAYTITVLTVGELNRASHEHWLPPKQRRGKPREYAVEVEIRERREATP